MKQIIQDYIHLTQMEFLLAHPFIAVGIPLIIVAVAFIYIQIKYRGK